MKLGKKNKKESTTKQKYSMLEKRANKFLKEQSSKEDMDEEEEELTSSFRDNLEEIDLNGMNNEAKDLAILKLMQGLVLDLLPIAERNYRKYPLHTNASAVNQLISQEREILADARALTSFQERANIIVDIVRQEYLEITANMIESIRGIESRFGKSKDLNKELQECLRQQGDYIKKSRENVSDRIIQLLVSNERKKTRSNNQ